MALSCMACTRNAHAAKRARELAESALDNMIECDVTPNQRDIRKRRLVKGQSIVRDARKDRGQ